jgi:predicted TIM-barrel enzyme
VKVLPVIHISKNKRHAIRNADCAFDAGCAGVFLIDMVRDDAMLVPMARIIKSRHPDKLVGVNFLARKPEDAVQASITAGLDMTWTDSQITHSDASPWEQAYRVSAAAKQSPGHLVFVGVAFKHQRDEPQPDRAANKAVELGFIPTTSGPRTGVAADPAKVAALRAAIGCEAPLAVASGLTPENVREFAPSLTHILVSTGVTTEFDEFDFEKLYRLRAIAEQM